MGLFWNRSKKQPSDGEAQKQGMFQRMLGRESGEDAPPISVEPPPPPDSGVSEFASVPPPPVEAPAPSVPSEIPGTAQQPEKAGFLGRFFGRGQASQPTAESAPPPPASPGQGDPAKPGLFKSWFSDAKTAPLTLPAEVQPSAPPVETEEEPKNRFLYRFKNAVQRTRQNLVGKLDTLLHGKKTISADVLDDLEEILIGADIGVQTTMDLVERIRSQVDRKLVNNADELRRLLKSELLELLKSPPPKRNFGRSVGSEAELDEGIRPYVMFMVGVNGVGKTTTIAKLANLIKSDGYEVLVCAADTFRAAASDQLAIWAERTGVGLIQQKPGTDPAAVVFDSLAAAKARDTDVVIVDTAGRLHTKVNLMRELEKMSRIAGREVKDAPHEILLVLDAATGQNGLEQARQFTKTVNVTGLVLTKLDGTAKGGIVVAIAKELGIPIRYIGTGEQLDDLVAFSAEDYVNSLFE